MELGGAEQIVWPFYTAMHNALLALQQSDEHTQEIISSNDDNNKDSDLVMSNEPETIVECTNVQQDLDNEPQVSCEDNNDQNVNQSSQFIHQGLMEDISGDEDDQADTLDLQVKIFIIIYISFTLFRKFSVNFCKNYVYNSSS